MGNLSKAFGTRSPRIPHIAAIVGQKEVADLRKDVEAAFLLHEGEQFKPVIQGIHSNKTDKVAPNYQGIGIDASTILSLCGSYLEGEKGRDKWSSLIAGANGYFSIHALNLGDTGLRVKILEGAGDAVAYSSTTKLITFTLLTKTVNEMIVLAEADPIINALIVVGKQGGNGTATPLVASAALTVTLVGGGVAARYVSCNGTANGQFWVYNKEPGYQDIYWQIIDDVTNANRYVEVIDKQIFVHIETGTTTAKAVKELIEDTTTVGGAAANALVGIWMVGTGAQAVHATDEDTAPVWVGVDGPPPAESDEEAISVIIGGQPAGHLGSNYNGLTTPPSYTFLAVYNDNTTMTSFAQNDRVEVYTTIDGQVTNSVTMQMVDDT
jgi:hypothetical protein